MDAKTDDTLSDVEIGDDLHEREYALRHAAFHFHAAEEFEALYELLTGDSNWMSLKFDWFGDDSPYIEDLQLALTDFYDPLTASELRVITKLYAALQIIFERTSHYDDKDLEILVLLGRTPIALNQARLRDVDAKFIAGRYSGLITIFKILSRKGEINPSLLEEAQSALSDIRDPDRLALSLSNLAIAYAMIGDIERALAAARKIEIAETYASTHYDLAHFFHRAHQEDEAYRLLSETWQNIEELQDGQVKIDELLLLRIEVFLNLAVSPPDISEVLNSFRARILAFQDEKQKQQAWCGFAVLLFELGYENQSREIIDEIDQNEIYVKALSEIGILLAREGKYELAQIELSAARDTMLSMPKDGWYDYRLSRLGSDMARIRWFSGATNLVNLISTPSNKRSVLQTAALELAQIGSFEEANRLWNEANDYAWGVPYNVNYEAALFAVVSTLIELRQLEYARQLAGQLRDSQLRATQLDEINKLVAEQVDSPIPERIASSFVPSAPLNEFEAELMNAKGLVSEADRFQALQELAKKLAAQGDFCRAFSSLEVRMAYQFLQTITTWANYIEQIESGLYVDLLREVTRIFSWILPAWHGVYENLDD